MGEQLLSPFSLKGSSALSENITLHLRGLRYCVYTSGAGAPLLMLHGFTGSGAYWGPFSDALSESHRLIAPDLLGHGGTDAPDQPERYRMEEAAADLVALADALEVPSPALFGYSMGGRLALFAALTYPQRFGALILESASPGLATAAEREARRAHDEALAQSVERDGIPEFVDRWQALPLFAAQQALPPQVREQLRSTRLAQRAHGLAGSLRGMGTGSQPTLWDRLHTLALPTLLLTGQLDDKFTAIATAMHASIPQARHVEISGAGHTPHLERPAETAQAVLAFLGGEHV